MESNESLQGFYERNAPDFTSLCLGVNKMGHFNVFSREHCSLLSPYSRRDYYKISLIIGKGKLHYADKWIYVDRPALLFSNPIVPYSWEAEDDDQKGWFCLFTESFLQNGSRLGIFRIHHCLKLAELLFSFWKKSSRRCFQICIPK